MTRLGRSPVFSVVNRHLGQVMGWRRFPFMIVLLLRLPSYRRQFCHATDDEGLRILKRKFLLAGALYHELARRIGQDRAFAATYSMLMEIANSVQRNWYIPPESVKRNWDRFHREHHHQMEHGLIRFNEHSEIVSAPDGEHFFITHCRFYESFRDMQVPELTEVFCRSDETVFNEYSPHLRFHRGADPVNTIARGAPKCAFIFEKI